MAIKKAAYEWVYAHVVTRGRFDSKNERILHTQYYNILLVQIFVLGKFFIRK